MQYIRLISLCLIAISLGLVAPSALAANLETGGTNYAAYDLGRYATDPTAANWTFKDSDPGSIRMVLAAYDLHPDVVQNQLQAMCQKGQKKISLVTWFFPFPEGVENGSINSTGGIAPARYQNNIKGVIDLIKNLKTDHDSPCFNELQFRFAPLSSASPLVWSSWNEKQYQENKSFIFAVRNLVKSSVNGSSINVYIDLGVELGGQDTGQNPAYLKQLWRDYTDQFGLGDTYGYSIAWDPGRFKKLMAVYDQTGKRPTQHAVDLYDPNNKGIKPQLEALYTEMQQTGETGTPILIQETYFNDQKAFSEITETARKLTMNIRSIMQWQVTRQDFFRGDGQYRHFSTVKPDYSYIASNPSDLNADGKVDIFDYNILVANFGNPYTIFDYNTLVANFGK